MTAHLEALSFSFWESMGMKNIYIYRSIFSRFVSSTVRIEKIFWISENRFFFCVHLCDFRVFRAGFFWDAIRFKKAPVHFFDVVSLYLRIFSLVYFQIGCPNSKSLLFFLHRRKYKDSCEILKCKCRSFNDFWERVGSHFLFKSLQM